MLQHHLVRSDTHRAHTKRLTVTAKPCLTLPTICKTVTKEMNAKDMTTITICTPADSVTILKRYLQLSQQWRIEGRPAL